MEYASGGELFDRIVRANRFSEDEARYFFQQLISGVAWCHKEVRWVAWRDFTWLQSRCSTLVCTSVAQAALLHLKRRPAAAMASHRQLRRCPHGGWTCLPYHSHAPLVLPLVCVHTGRVPPRPEAGEHAAGWPASAAPQNLRLWLLKGGGQRCSSVDAWVRLGGCASMECCPGPIDEHPPHAPALTMPHRLGTCPLACSPRCSTRSPSRQ